MLAMASRARKGSMELNCGAHGCGAVEEKRTATTASSSGEKKKAKEPEKNAIRLHFGAAGSVEKTETSFSSPPWISLLVPSPPTFELPRRWRPEFRGLEKEKAAT